MDTKRLEDEIIHFALHTKYEDIPEPVIENLKKSLLDSIGVMTAASFIEPACGPFIKFAVENSADRSCTIFGTDHKASVLMASLANGALIHALDYEDGHDDSKSHPNTASIPVLMAISESRGKSGQELLAAMAVASELAVRMKLSLTANDLADCGLYSPPMFSAYGAVLGASRLLGLGEDQALDALSIALTQVLLPGQSARSKRSVLRGVRDAFSARAAAFGALMAEQGVCARMDDALQGPFGLYMCCFRSQYDPSVILKDLGTRWEIERLRYKAWPCCGTSHAVISAIFDLKETYNIRSEDVERIRLIINQPHLNLLEPRDVKYRPGSMAAAKFSLPFASALAMKYGKVTLDSYTDDALTDPELLGIAAKVEYALRPVEDGHPKSFYGDDHVEVTITTNQGEFSQELFESYGSPDKPLSKQQFQNKFIDCMAHGYKTYDRTQSEKIADAVYQIDSLDSVSTLCSLL